MCHLCQLAISATVQAGRLNVNTLMLKCQARHSSKYLVLQSTLTGARKNISSSNLETYRNVLSPTTELSFKISRCGMKVWHNHVAESWIFYILPFMSPLQHLPLKDNNLSCILFLQGGNLECSKDSDDISVGSLCLKKWFRTAKAIVLYLNDGTLQVNICWDKITKTPVKISKSSCDRNVDVFEFLFKNFYLSSTLYQELIFTFKLINVMIFVWEIAVSYDVGNEEALCWNVAYDAIMR